MSKGSHTGGEAAAYAAPKPAAKASRHFRLVALDGLDEKLGYRLRMAYIAASRHFAAAMARLDLTQKQTGVLWLIGANPGASQTAIAEALGMDRASMMAIVNRLEELALLKRERSEHDGRRQALYLTPKGRRTLAQAKAAIERHEHWMAARFAPEELVVFSESLGRLLR